MFEEVVIFRVKFIIDILLNEYVVKLYFKYFVFIFKFSVVFSLVGEVILDCG